MAEENSGKKILITGVSQGLGRALALELAKRGHTIIGCSRNQTKLDLLQPIFSNIPPYNHLLLNLDVVFIFKSFPSFFCFLILSTSFIFCFLHFSMCENIFIFQKLDDKVKETLEIIVEKIGVPDIIGIYMFLYK